MLYKRSAQCRLSRSDGGYPRRRHGATQTEAEATGGRKDACDNCAYTAAVAIDSNGSCTGRSITYGSQSQSDGVLFDSLPGVDLSWQWSQAFSCGWLVNSPPKRPQQTPGSAKGTPTRINTAKYRIRPAIASLFSNHLFIPPSLYIIPIESYLFRRIMISNGDCVFGTPHAK